VTAPGRHSTSAPEVAELRSLVGAIPDPEIPVLSIADLGMLRDLRKEGDRVEVEITPTYSGCPALEAIRADIESLLRRHGCREVRVRTVLEPAWTTDWMSEAARQALRDHGIAPPGLRALPMAGDLRGVPCPRCGSTDTEVISRFSSTACKALLRCRSCAEPFDHLKAH